MKNRRAPRSSAFTLVELLAVLGVIALLLTIALAVMMRSREQSNRVKCARHLRAIGQTILLYLNDNRGKYPRTAYAPGPVVTPTWGTSATATDPFAPSGPGPNDVSAVLFLLARTYDVSPEILVCPSADQRPWDFGGSGRTVQNWSNWNGTTGVAQHLSYSYANPYQDDWAASSYRISSTAYGADYALAADKNRGGNDVLAVTVTSPPRAMRRGNSRNHNGSGQNVLFADGHVDFHDNPFCGVRRDNIYARRAGAMGLVSAAIAASPYDHNDSVLLPCDP